MDTVEAYNGELYIVMRDVLDGEPTEVANFYPLGIRDYSLSYLIGRKVTYRLGVFRDEHGTVYPLRDGPNSKPTHTERKPVPEPQQRGRKLETKWLHGAWHKLTRNGWTRA